MIVSTVLLTHDNFYVDEYDELPTRPQGDKELLTALCKGKCVSAKAYTMLPPSIKALVTIGNTSHIEMPITINEIGTMTDLLIVVRSNELIVQGKQFRLHDFKRLINTEKVEIWIRY